MSPADALRRRLVIVSVVVVLLLAVAVDVLLYVRLRSELLGNLGPDVPRTAVDASLRRVVAIEVLATLVAGGLSAVVFGRVAAALSAPMERMLEVVRRQAAGHQGTRIRPEPDCLIADLGRAYDEMLDAQERAIAATLAARDRSRHFLADAAHQIRTPVAGIQACAETLLRRPTSGRPDQEQLLSDMLHETSRMGRLVSDLLQTARLDQGVDLKSAPCDLLALCREQAERVRRVEPALEIITLAPGWNGLRPALDAKAVHDILVNVLDNARRHAATRVSLTVVRAAATVEVRVADDGPGLPQELAERVFERFVSLEGWAGSALGLPIARDLARAHGGDICYRDHAFVVSLPWVANPAVQPASQIDHTTADRAFTCTIH